MVGEGERRSASLALHRLEELGLLLDSSSHGFLPSREGDVAGWHRGQTYSFLHFSANVEFRK